VRRTPANQRALEGTKGLIIGNVERFDESRHVFARNRALIPGSDPYKAFYQKHPELEGGDAARREKGGPLGHPGTVDRPHDGSNVAATFASSSLCMWLSTLDKVKPQAHPVCKGRTIELSPEEASIRVNGFAKSIGAALVGITEINPLWVFSHKGEIFHENWEDWGKVGTDCNVCMKVCPWSHANTMPHQMIKWLVSRNSISRRLFAVMDDIFYGKRPKARPAPKWAQFKAFNPK
jgi:hypothetical protein